MAMNNLTLEGNLVADPELRYTPSGVAVANFRIAHTPRRFDKTTNQWTDGETLFLTVNAWKQLGENIAQSLTKGSSVTVIGRLEQRTFQTREGEDRTVYEVTAENIGPSLRWATATIQRNPSGRNGGGGAATSNDPWGGAPAGNANDEEPPF